MDVLTSTEFRKRYARLTEPTLVVVNGHSIGIWNPAHGAATNSLTIERPGRATEHYSFGPEHGQDHFLEFRPAPKPGRK